MNEWPGMIPGLIFCPESGHSTLALTRKWGTDRKPLWASLRKEVAPMEQFLLDVLANVLAGVIVVLVAPYLKK